MVATLGLFNTGVATFQGSGLKGVTVLSSNFSLQDKDEAEERNCHGLIAVLTR